MNSSLTFRPVSVLCKSEVVRIGRTPAANQTRMSCDEFEVFDCGPSLRVGKTARFDLFDNGSSGHLRSFALKCRCVLVHRSKARWPRIFLALLTLFERILRLPRICDIQRVLSWRIRRAQMAAVSTDSTSLKLNTAHKWLFRPALAEMTSSFAARPAGIFCLRCFRAAIRSGSPVQQWPTRIRRSLVGLRGTTGIYAPPYQKLIARRYFLE